MDRYGRSQDHNNRKHGQNTKSGVKQYGGGVHHPNSGALFVHYLCTYRKLEAMGRTYLVKYVQARIGFDLYSGLVVFSKVSTLAAMACHKKLLLLQPFLGPHVQDLQVPEPACALPADDPAASTAVQSTRGPAVASVKLRLRAR